VPSKNVNDRFEISIPYRSKTNMQIYLITRKTSSFCGNKLQNISDTPTPGATSIPTRQQPRPSLLPAQAACRFFQRNTYAVCFRRGSVFSEKSVHFRQTIGSASMCGNSEKQLNITTLSFELEQLGSNHGL